MVTLITFIEQFDSLRYYFKTKCHSVDCEKDIFKIFG